MRFSPSTPVPKSQAHRRRPQMERRPRSTRGEQQKHPSSPKRLPESMRPEVDERPRCKAAGRPMTQWLPRMLGLGPASQDSKTSASQGLLNATIAMVLTIPGEPAATVAADWIPSHCLAAIEDGPGDNLSLSRHGNQGKAKQGVHQQQSNGDSLSHGGIPPRVQGTESGRMESVEISESVDQLPRTWKPPVVSVAPMTVSTEKRKGVNSGGNRTEKPTRPGVATIHSLPLPRGSKVVSNSLIQAVFRPAHRSSVPMGRNLAKWSR